MKKSYLIKNAQIVNEGSITHGDVLINAGRIEKVAAQIDQPADEEIDAGGHYLIPGIIDDQVHFREPGLTHKAELYTEARAAVAGGVTSYMEMPNTKPPAITQERLQNKYDRAAEVSLANYSFFMGTSNDNLEEVLKTSPRDVCGIKIFMGSSTGNMLVDDKKTLEKVFANAPVLIATHCEDEITVRENLSKYKAEYGENIPAHAHPEIRNMEACYRSSSFAVNLAKRNNTRLHILHLTTQKELELFTNEIPLEEKNITAEVCVHHLWFDKSDYKKYGNRIKCNPAIKEARHRKALFQGLLSDKLDVIATDHAPHTKEEKQNKYIDAPAGIPLVQHGLNVMLKFYRQGAISLEQIVEKMCHAPARCFEIEKRGYIQEGYFADLALVDLDTEWQVKPENIYYKCDWSPFEEDKFNSKVTHTFVNGHLAYREGTFDESEKGQRLLFDRD